MRDLQTEAGGLKLRNPLIAASGCFGYGLDYDPLLPPETFGAIVTKTITPMLRAGNPVPRIRETASGILNSIGLENVGLERFLSDKLPALMERDLTLVVSISAGTVGEFADMAERLAKENQVAALELNLSCPNVAAHGRNFATDPEQVSEICRAVRPVFEGPVWVKLTPNVTDIVSVARAAEESGADAVTAINTLLGMDIDLATGKSPFANGVAGLSGPAILPVALAAVWRIRQALEIPVIGVGGIATSEDVRKFLHAGASAVQLGSSIFMDPRTPFRILDELSSRDDLA
ncbi:MAG: dihydroorotate dehydrogenase [Candidatus Krumholzibacteria bacterium]|jgi:dihydroorotate dehydrogenase (NAD+) catalytic subunit|nr:dihydroorotate dehydrogenase [Candidatus Krumholzibacteria bacterium]MDP6669380.1 dihydroorotate dehydrogenase [Candidatus Krumholzibacteria bacterium]MDP6797206.1 dihydroorotate dehydrogenase [Candidatus Krumholzibacteria bacterium]